MFVHAEVTYCVRDEQCRCSAVSVTRTGGRGGVIKSSPSLTSNVSLCSSAPLSTIADTKLKEEKEEDVRLLDQRR